MKKPRSPKSKKYLSLIDLGAIDDFRITGCEPGFIQKIHAVRKKCLRDFTADEVRVCLAQGVGTVYLVQKALDLLEVNPWIETEYFEGDLLKTCIDVPDDYWKDRKKEKDRMKIIMQAAHKQIANGKVSTGRQEIRDLDRGFQKFELNTEIPGS